MNSHSTQISYIFEVYLKKKFVHLGTFDQVCKTVFRALIVRIWSQEQALYLKTIELKETRAGEMAQG